MTDDKRAGEWAVNNPYDHEDCDSDFGGCGDKCKRGAYENGYTDGRKAAEKDLEELLEMTEYVVDRIGDSGPFGQMHALEKFRAWKKARGIE